MTNRTLTLRSLDIPQINRFGIGFDTMLDDLLRIANHQTTSNYPPYNVVKTGEDTVTIEMAVAGFGENEISMQVDNRTLTVSGSQNREENLDHEYLHRGLSHRDFVQHFTLAEYVEVDNAECKNGILSIYLARKVPDEKKPKLIQISYTK